MATLKIEIDKKSIREFVAMSDMDLTDDQLAKIDGSTVEFARAQLLAFTDSTAFLTFIAGLVVYQNLAEND